MNRLEANAKNILTRKQLQIQLAKLVTISDYNIFRLHIHLYIVKVSIQRVSNSIALVYETLLAVQ